MRNKTVLICLLCLLCESLLAQPKTDTLLQNMLLRSKSPRVHRVLQGKDTFRLQIIYTQINRDKKNRPSFKNFYVNVDSNLYYNPASTVKLPLAFLSLEKLNAMAIKGVNLYTAMQFDSLYPWQIPVLNDTTSKSGFPSLDHYIKKAFLISDNDAYNRMYQFLGQQTIKRKLEEKGYAHTRITRQFMGLTEEENRHTNPIRFLDSQGKVIYSQSAAYNPDPFYFGKVIKVGKAHYSNGKLINQPIDFTKVNNVPLEDLQQMLQSVMFPESVPARQRFALSSSDYDFLYRFLSQYPSETNYPKYDTTQYYNSYVKFYFRDSVHQMPDYVRVFNKVGWAYGFLTDVSYVVDFKNKVEFMLTTTVYVNRDEILNDNQYEYETVGWPFLYDLGQTVYQYELQRKRKYLPDLQKFKIRYEQRDPNDTRPSIRDADN